MARNLRGWVRKLEAPNSVAKNLVIVESPAKAKTIKRYLGSDYQVMPSVGHVVDLPKSKLGVDIEHNFAPDFVVIKGKEKIIGEIKTAAKARQSRGTFPSISAKPSPKSAACCCMKSPRPPSERPSSIPRSSTTTCSTPTRPGAC